MLHASTGFVTLFILLSVRSSVELSINSVRGRDALDYAPLIDGHNDLPYNLYLILNNKLADFHFEKNLSNDSIWGNDVCSSCYTDLPRLAAGKVGGQFWVAYTDCDSQYKDSVQLTLRQIDVIKRLIQKYPNNLQFVTNAADIESAWKSGKIASMIAVEGGHSLDSSLAVLRLYHEIGVRYITLTHTCNTPWADASPVNNNSVYNLTEFGKAVVKEMNRLGIMVDLSHVSHNVMRNAIEVSKAPVIFSHSSAFSICNNYRNVPDDVLLLVKNNKGIVMVNFYNEFINCNSMRNTTLEDVVDHINYIRNFIGVDHVGIGADYDGVQRVPVGLEDVSKYPDLFDRLYDNKVNETSWSRDDLEKLAGRNLIRVFQDVEAVRDQMSSEPPNDSIISGQELYIAQKNDGKIPGSCQSAIEWQNVNVTTAQSSVSSG